MLVRWAAWAPRNATAATIDALEAGRTAQAETWYIYLGTIPPSWIVSCMHTVTRIPVVDWQNALPPDLDAPAVPPWRTDAWHRQLLKQVKRAA
jgi:hypothetical protein